MITRKGLAAPMTSWRQARAAADINLAYPTAGIAVMGPEGAVNIIFRRADRALPPPEPARPGAAATARRSMPPVSQKFANPTPPPRLGYVDEVIRPRETPERSSPRCYMLRNKPAEPAKKHGNIPL